MKHLFLSFFFLVTNLLAQSFSGNTGIITDNKSTLTFTCNVSGLTSSSNSSFGIESICLNISHTRVSDLDVKLFSPDGSYIQLFKSIGGSGDHFNTTCLNQSAANFIKSGSAPFNGTYKPMEELGLLNNGQNPNGTWSLKIRDQTSGTQGNLNSWNLTFSNTPAPAFSSNLPIMIINTNGNSIVDDPKVMADLKIVRNSVGRNSILGPFEYEGKMGIEIRGSSSSGFPKKSYGIELWDANGIQIDTSIMGMAKESDFALIANYSDKSLMNNMLAYNLYRDMSHYAPDNVYCEVILNKSYAGVYLLTEKIKRDSNRVSIAKLLPADTIGAEITGGYIFKIDKPTGSGGDGWNSSYLSPAFTTISFQYEYPDMFSIHQKQKDYIKAVMDNFENALYGPNFNHPNVGYRNYFKLRGLLDYFLLNEVSRNVDGLRISTFIYKEKSTDGNKLAFIPWDYDLGFGNADYCDGWLTSGWSYEFPNVCPSDGNQVPFWWDRFMQDSAFKADLKCRYEYLRTTLLSTSRLHQYIDSVAAVLNEGSIRNFNTYTILGTYVWPNPTPIATNYAGEINELKNWLDARLTWLDQNMPGTCINLNLNEKAEIVQNISASPNPTDSKSLLSWESDKSQELQVLLLNSVGQVMLQNTVQAHPGENLLELNLDPFQPGLYILSLRQGNLVQSYKLIRK